MSCPQLTRKARRPPGSVCMVQVTTQQDDKVSEAVTWAPGVELNESKTKLVAIPAAWK